MEKIAKWCVGLVILLIAGVSFAVEIYCPECKIALYDYQHELIMGEKLEAAYTIPLQKDIPAPKDSDPFSCPKCGVPLNGWEYYGVRHKSKHHVVNGNYVSILTKENGKFKWMPYDVPDCEVK